MKNNGLMSYKNELLAIIDKHIPVGRVYLFGSRARGSQTRGSDIDIAIDTGQPADGFALSNIREEIEESTIPFFVDFLDFQTLDKDMQQTILSEGILWRS